MTKKLYWEDSYQKEFDAKVVSVDGNKVVLDQTCFYPLGGGQPNDTGEINGIKVTDVKKEGGNIVHILDREPDFKAGDTVHGKLDWERRYKIMKLHTADHVVATLINKKTGALITGGNIYEDRSRFDFNLEKFDKEQMGIFLKEAEKIMETGLEVKTYILPREEAMKIDGVSKLAKGLPETIKELRIVEIGDFDKQADGGTHVKNTKEIGKIEIIKCENKGKNNRRLYFRLVS